MTKTKTMKAMVITDFGSTNVLKSQEMPVPKPQGKELLVKVHATSVNPVDCKIRKGMFGPIIKTPAILGFDVSGVVEAIGDKVTDFKVGDEVYYLPRIIGWQGAYAEYHLVEEAIVSKKPSNLSHTEAASIPLAASTAWDALVERAKVKIGETVLIHAGAGGVGSLAIQLAKLCGAYVFATCSDYNFDLVKEIGADKIINYKKENFIEIIKEETNGEGVDVVFDTVGGEVLTKSIDITKPFGRISSIVRTGTEGINLEKAYLQNISLHCVFVQSGRHKLDTIRNLIEQEQLKPVIDSVMLLSDVAKAHKKLEQGGTRGKIVLSVV